MKFKAKNNPQIIPFYEIKMGVGVTIREISKTDTRLALAEFLKKKGKCPHTFRYDLKGGIYTNRFCYTCDEHLGLVGQ